MLEPKIIYEDSAVIVVDKPAGLPVHADGKNEKATLVDWLLTHYPDLSGVGEVQKLPSGEILERPGIVHRLDAQTSGVLVVARTQESFANLKTQFQEREVKKTYRAFVNGSLKEERGTIDRPIGSSRGGKGPRSATRPHGVMRDAVTMWRLVARGKGVSYVEAFPQTGRTHQIRVHFSSIGHPIVCDPLYGSGRAPQLGFSRLALHAHTLSFTHPTTGEKVSFEAPLPSDFVEAEKELRQV